MVELVKFLVENLVDDKEAVTVTQEGETIKVSAAASDIGKIIGRQGKIAKAIRTVVKAAGMKNGNKYNVEIIENEK